MLNQCQFIGNLGADPECKTFQSGDRIANLRLAVTERWKDKQSGERKERTEWVSITLRAGLVDVAEKYLRKGSKVFVSGKMATRKWQDKDGSDRYSTEIMGNQLVMLDSKPDGQQSGGGSGSQSRPSRPPFDDDLDDDVPFVSADPMFEGRCG
ncbi:MULTISPECIES: single-stranded DNA-binding protein [Alphaproteobacteria]|jgi:single-strand DNA-binding protein|uniref:single-stranded DNA-binding protein n=1 Tax=Sphingopyxis sp. TaxID=1908224 RepID=UPI0040337436